MACADCLRTTTLGSCGRIWSTALRNILTALILAEHVDGFIADAPPGWRVHRLIGDRQGEWSVSVSGNWRITFEEEAGYIDRLKLEDYHWLTTESG